MPAERDTAPLSATEKIASGCRRPRASRMAWTVAFVTAAVTAGILATAAGPASARRIGPSLALSRTAGGLQVSRLIVSPRRHAMLTQTPVRLVVRAPRGSGRLLMVLNNHRARLRVPAGRRVIVRLTARRGLRRGINQLMVSRDRGRRTIAEAISFVVLRRAPALARARLRRGGGSAANVSVNVSVGPALTQQRLGAVLAAVRSVQRRRVFRAWVDGREVSGRFDNAKRSRWTASLSVSDGLRAGCNRVRLFVAEPVQGRYATLRRRVCLPTQMPLAGAGLDQVVHAGTPVRLDGRSSRAVGGGALRFRWVLVSHPAGSRARVRRANSPRALLTPDRAGRYRLRLTVVQRRLRGRHGSVAARAAAGRSTSDAITVTTQPPAQDLLVPFATNVIDPSTGSYGVRVGGTVYDNPNPGGHGLQVVTIDRTKLQVTNAAYTDASALLSQLQHGTLNQLVVLAAPPGASDGAVIPADVKTFDLALASIGAPPVPQSVLTGAGQPLSIIGVPRAGAGSGWFTPGGHVGWLSPDTSSRYAFTPNAPKLDTSSASTANSNTMTVGTTPVTSTAPGGGAGWQVVGIDPLTFALKASQAFDGSNLSAFPGFVNGLAAAGDIVAVQSFGTNPVALDPGSAQALQSIGATSTAIANGTPYAFVGGPQLAPSDVVETNGPPGPTSIVGRASPGHSDGVFTLAAHVLMDQNDPDSDFTFALYDVIHQAPTPWPYTATNASFPTFAEDGCASAGPNTAQNVQGYASALAYIAKGIGLSDYTADLRAAYLKLDQGTWSDRKDSLTNLAYSAGQGFTQAQFCNLKAELQNEFTWMDSVKQYLFDPYKEVFNRASGPLTVDLQSIGQAVKHSMPTDNTKTIIFHVLDVVGELANFASFFPEEELSQALVSSIQSAIAEGENYATDGGSPIGDQIDTKVSDLSNQVATQYANIAATMDNQRDIVISDYGRLSRLGPLATSPDIAINSQKIEQFKDAIELGAKRAFTTALLPIAFHVYHLASTAGNPNPTTDNCATNYNSIGGGYKVPFDGEPAGGQVAVNGTLYALGHGDPFANSPFDSFKLPNPTLLAPLYVSPDQGGLGFYKPWLLLRSFAPYSAATCLYTSNS